MRTSLNWTLVRTAFVVAAALTVPTAARAEEDAAYADDTQRQSFAFAVSGDTLTFTDETGTRNFQRCK